MAALKKAYADIILNTAKEAASRIMVSERKALCFQQDLFNAKEESLNMLLRLKQMMDSKISEAELISLSQQRRIEELEAQLDEAEDIVRDLRAELKGMQGELEMVKNNQVQPLDEQIVKGDAASQEDASQENKLHASESIFPPDSVFGPITTSSMNNTHSNLRNTDNNCCNSTTQTEPSSDSLTEKYYSGNPDLASIIMRSKEPELYRNGCTQRIRAIERNLLDGKLLLSGQIDDQYSQIKYESMIKDDEKSEGICTVTSPKSDNMGVIENPTGLEEVMQHNSRISSCVKGQAVKVICKRKRRARYRKTKAISCRSRPDQVMKACQSSLLSCSKTYPYSVNGNIQSGKESSKITENKAQKDLESYLAPELLSNTTDMDPASGCANGTESEVVEPQKDIVLMEKAVLTRQETEVAESSDMPGCKLNLETVDEQLMNSDLKDAKTSETTNGALPQAGLLKYTFRRKRKKESLGSPDENTSLKKNNLKRRTGVKQNGVLEPQKSSLIIESSRDSRRLAQVARQLISLSEKRW
ncbi:hypothetical protein HHK36_007121 [Tetracentron sinense]|uniref:Uncharacterized protein n=1 Tax=Tetracentron sinense TaxID=13715 RepID=A0A834ZJ81_TETSI|nr:hypothetical protein HHK36_007121 [Tetracentron sinense]